MGKVGVRIVSLSQASESEARDFLAGSTSGLGTRWSYSGCDESTSKRTVFKLQSARAIRVRGHVGFLGTRGTAAAMTSHLLLPSATITVPL